MCQVSKVHKEVSEAVTKRCSIKKLLGKISQNSKENNCARVSYSLQRK